MLMAMLSAYSAFSATQQVVTCEPMPLKENSKDVVVYFHADQGSKGLMGVGSTTEIYAHTGVSVQNSKGIVNDWQYTPSKWGDNSAKYKLEYVSANLWKLKIGDIRTYYGVKANEIVTKLCFVFRDKDCKKEGKGVGGTDIFIDVEHEGGVSVVSKPSALSEPPAMGATRNADGTVTFCLAAPQKKGAAVIGSWNNFEVVESQFMNYIDSDLNGTTCRFFEITLPSTLLEKGKQYSYCYYVDGKTVGDPYAHLVLDPWNDKYISTSVFPNMPTYPSAHINGVMLAVFDDRLGQYNWQTLDFKRPAKSNLIIYEMLIRDFTGTEGEACGNGTLRGAIDKIPYLKNLGINAVELMPVNEFNGNNSWGYNPNFYFALDKAYGRPEDLKEFVDKCHAEGIAVILDMVFNQSDGLHPWYQLYAAAENPFYNASAPHAYNVLNDWKQEFPLVERQWRDVVQYWIKEYHIDGYRFDLVKGLGDSNSYASNSESETNKLNHSRIDRMKRIHSYIKEVDAEAYMINENLAGAEEENQMAADGQLNWANVNSAGCQYAMGFSSGADMNRFWAKRDQRLSASTISYLESHDEERLAYKQKQYGEATVKGDLSVSALRLGSAAAQMLLTPGGHMIWQFSEFGNAQTTKKSDGGNNVDPKIVNWQMAENVANKGLLQSYRELIKIRLENSALFSSENDSPGFSMACGTADWAKGRLISAKVDGKEIYVCINPNVAGSVIELNPNFENSDNSSYEILSQSPEGGAKFNAAQNWVTVRPNCYVVIGSKGLTSKKEEIVEQPSRGEIALEGNFLHLKGMQYPTMVYSIAGQLVSSVSEPNATILLAGGVYIVRSGSKNWKILVKNN